MGLMHGASHAYMRVGSEAPSQALSCCAAAQPASAARYARGTTPAFSAAAANEEFGRTEHVPMTPPASQQQTDHDARRVPGSSAYASCGSPAAAGSTRASG
jgi:hypothetical protein